MVIPSSLAESPCVKRSNSVDVREASENAHPESVIVSTVIVFAIHDLRSSPDHPLGEAVETFVRREDAERFVEEVRGDDPRDGGETAD